MKGLRVCGMKLGWEKIINCCYENKNGKRIFHPEKSNLIRPLTDGVGYQNGFSSLVVSDGV